MYFELKLTIADIIWDKREVSFFNQIINVLLLSKFHEIMKSHEIYLKAHVFFEIITFHDLMRSWKRMKPLWNLMISNEIVKSHERIKSDKS